MFPAPMGQGEYDINPDSVLCRIRVFIWGCNLLFLRVKALKALALGRPWVRIFGRNPQQ